MHVDERVQSLKEFQISVIQHAMTFPNVQKIVYSTCSIYYEENEGVVAHVSEFAKEHGFHLAEALPSWPRRGLVLQQGEREDDVLSAGEAKKVLRVDPIEDGTDGFFVAMFVK
jgi:putative methyltransferase